MKPYRKNVGIVVFNRAGRALVGERLKPPGALQFPQGGLEVGESPEQAARRELYEETGLLLNGEPAGAIDEWLAYDFPATVPKRMQKYRGQKQKWFFYFWDGDPAALKLDLHEREFRRMIWIGLGEILEMIVDFKRPVYKIVCDRGRVIIANYLKDTGIQD